MRYAGALEKAKRNYEKISHPSEAARSDYITRLVRMREKAADLRTDEWQAIDTEIKRHPAPNDPGSKTFSSLLGGKWESPRHDYLFSGPMAHGRCCRLKRISPTGFGALRAINTLTPPPRSHPKRASTPLS